MIDIEKIKALPDEKPRKGPHKMSKSGERRCEARRRYKAEQRARRLDEYYRSVRQRIVAAMGVPAEYVFGPRHHQRETND